jgi:hypothetical protein
LFGGKFEPKNIVKNNLEKSINIRAIFAFRAIPYERNVARWSGGWAVYP